MPRRPLSQEVGGCTNYSFVPGTTLDGVILNLTFWCSLSSHPHSLSISLTLSCLQEDAARNLVSLSRLQEDAAALGGSERIPEGVRDSAGVPRS